MTSPLTTTVAGSRRPFTLPADKLAHHSELRQGSPAHTAGTVSLNVSKLRRKQLRTYQSPLASGAVELRMETGTRSYAAKPTSSATTPATSIASSVTDEDALAHLNKKHVYPTEPPLPLYHPKGQLALSLPELDPALFGLASNAINIDDHDIRGNLQDFDSRRASSRARRPAAKLREVVGGGDEEEANDVANAANGKKAADASGQARSTSPRKRRTAGSGAAGGGGKRRRKDADDADGTYPNPVNRRTRNARGAAAAAAVASPLAGPAVVADAEPDEGDGEGDRDGDDAGTVAGEAAEPAARTTRSRRSRATAPKRRGSSASETTTTSVSVSIAANARTTRSGGAKRPSDDDMPVDGDEPILAQPADDKVENSAITLASPKDAIDTPTQKGDVATEQHVTSSTADLPVKSKESIDSNDKNALPEQPELGNEPQTQEKDSSDNRHVQSTLKTTSSSNQSAELPTKDGEDDHAVESASKMDVDTPEDVAPSPALVAEERDPATSESSKPRSPSPPAPNPAPAPLTPASNGISTKPVPEPFVVPVSARAQTTVSSQPPSTSTKPDDDEKEEGELSDE
ncbi:hypothetical protein BC629DRAFT_1473063 [Irpex lacteus]|nr:hypothetical protein BC629DRAFT_1473063 [Irpex lacteus]